MLFDKWNFFDPGHHLIVIGISQNLSKYFSGRRGARRLLWVSQRIQSPGLQKKYIQSRVLTKKNFYIYSERKAFLSSISSKYFQSRIFLFLILFNLFSHGKCLNSNNLKYRVCTQFIAWFNLINSIVTKLGWQWSASLNWYKMFVIKS